MNKKCIAIIPARGGSKRIPRKNIKKFHGKPLIAYSIELALSANLFDRIVVSTEDEEIAEIAKQYGAETPFMRPKNLADDFTGIEAVRDHAVQYFREIGECYDYSCMIFATAPLLRKRYLLEGFDKIKNSTAFNAFGVATFPFPVQRTFKKNKNGRCQMFTPEFYMTRSQDLEEAYQDAGQFYWTNWKNKPQEGFMFSNDSIPIVIPRHLVQDIDTPEDWKYAELMFEVLEKSKG